MKSFERASLAIIILLLFVHTISAQKVWEKDWQKWNKGDVSKILTQSPWVYSFTSIEVVSGYTRLNPSSDSVPSVTFRLYSSQTIRRALLRLKQIDEKYEKMDEKQKLEFDKKNDTFLNCEQCDKYYVLIMLQQTELTSKSLVADRFKELKFTDLKDYVYLSNEKKERRELSQYIAPNSVRDPVIFFFSRLDANQNPLITNENKKIVLNFKTNIRNDAVQEKIEFDVSKLVIDGKVDF